MTLLSLKNLFLSNTPLKIISLFFGYSFWYIATFNQIIMFNVRASLFFASSDHYAIDAPEFINVTIQGKRSHLYALNDQSLGVHIDIKNLSQGTHTITLTKKNLFLPRYIKLVDYQPSDITITITDNSSS